MKRLLIPLTLLLALVLAACVPATVDEDPAPGVTLTATETDTFTVYRLETAEPLDLALLRFQGTDLEANAEECNLVDGALECSFGEVDAFVELAVAGTVTNSIEAPFGVTCADGDCAAVFLTPPE